MNAYATINKHRKFHGVLFTYSAMFMQDQENTECENYVDDILMRQMDKLQWMMSQMSHAK